MARKILLVEDDPFLSEIYITKFEQVGYEVEIATDGESAVKKAHEIHPDVMLLDIVLPKMNGLEVLAELKKDSSVNDIKMIVLSNLGSDEDISRAKEIGADGYLVKSQYTPSEVVSQIENVINEKN
ncbi:MAG: response regulator [Candidatus Spechtbacterales bacterium]|nr:response regulator [Candidatus Spechtbacterales bacterium]